MHFYWYVRISLYYHFTFSASSIRQMFEYSRMNHGFDSTNLWRCMVWQIHDLTSNIRIFEFDRVKIPFTGDPQFRDPPNAATRSSNVAAQRHLRITQRHLGIAQPLSHEDRSWFIAQPRLGIVWLQKCSCSQHLSRTTGYSHHCAIKNEV